MHDSSVSHTESIAIAPVFDQGKSLRKRRDRVQDSSGEAAAAAAAAESFVRGDIAPAPCSGAFRNSFGGKKPSAETSHDNLATTDRNGTHTTPKPIDAQRECNFWATTKLVYTYHQTPRSVWSTPAKRRHR